MDDLRHLHPHGVFLRREALAAGYDDSHLYGALASGAIARVRHGAFVDGRIWRRANEVARHVLGCHAVALSHSPPVAISHTSGALLHGVQAWGVDLGKVHVSRPASAVGRVHRDVAYHRDPVAVLRSIDGTPTLDAAPSVLGAACVNGVEAGVVLVDSAYHLGICTPADLLAEFEGRRGWPGTARLQITLRLAQPGAESVAESRMRYLFWQRGLPKPELQYVVRDGSEVIGISDFAWPAYGLLGEFDGRIKYEELLRPGERPSDVVVREKKREDRMREATGWAMIRFTWADLNDPDRTEERVRRALDRRR